MKTKLNTEKYKGFNIEFIEHKDNNHRFVEVKIKENNKLIVGRDMPTKQEGFDWARDYIDNNYKEDDSLDGWKKIAKQELEKQLGVKTRVTDYSYYTDKGALSLESISGEANNGESEWIVFKDYDTAEKVAINKVREDLEDDPNLFSQDWLQNYIDDERLKNDLEYDVEEEARSYYEDIANEYDSEYGNRQIRELVEGGYLDEIEDLDEDGDIAEQYENLSNYDSALEDAISDMAKDKLSDGGVEYLKEIYGDEDGIKKAMELGGIDYDEASEDAVSQDGVAHFLDVYDGEEVELPSGAIAFGTN